MAVLRDHIKIKHLKLKYECDICGHKVNSKKNLKIHKNVVHEGIWLHCPETGCDYKAKDSSTFRLNMFCVVFSLFCISGITRKYCMMVKG